MRYDATGVDEMHTRARTQHNKLCLCVVACVTSTLLMCAELRVFDV